MLTEATPQSWRVSEGTVPLTDVMRTAKCSYASLDVATRNGLIPIVRQGGRGNARHITLDDALLIVAVAALAVAAGLAFGAMLRAIRDTGATITPAGLTIPLNTAP